MWRHSLVADGSNVCNLASWDKSALYSIHSKRENHICWGSSPCQTRFFVILIAAKRRIVLPSFHRWGSTFSTFSTSSTNWPELHSLCVSDVGANHGLSDFTEESCYLKNNESLSRVIHEHSQIHAHLRHDSTLLWFAFSFQRQFLDSFSFLMFPSLWEIDVCVLARGGTWTGIGEWYWCGGSDGEEAACNAADPGSIPGLGRCPGEGNAYPLQCFYPENSLDRGVWHATSPWGHKELDMSRRLTHSCRYNGMMCCAHVTFPGKLRLLCEFPTPRTRAGWLML